MSRESKSRSQTASSAVGGARVQRARRATSIPAAVDELIEHVGLTSRSSHLLKPAGNAATNRPTRLGCARSSGPRGSESPSVTYHSIASGSSAIWLPRGGKIAMWQSRDAARSPGCEHGAVRERAQFRAATATAPPRGLYRLFDGGEEERAAEKPAAAQPPSAALADSASATAGCGARPAAADARVAPGDCVRARPRRARRRTPPEHARRIGRRRAAAAARRRRSRRRPLLGGSPARGRACQRAAAAA